MIIEICCMFEGRLYTFSILSNTYGSQIIKIDIIDLYY